MNDTESTKTDKPGQQAKRAAVVIGRFNPPTIAHYAVFKRLKDYVVKNPDLKLEAVPLVVVVQGEKTSKDKKRNPLSANERISFMSASGNADGVKFLVAPSAFAGFEAVRKAGYEPIVIAAGSDRGMKYKELLDKYFKTKDGEPIEHHVLEIGREESDEKVDKEAAMADVLEYMDGSLPISMVSGSLARLAVQHGDREKFKIITGLQKKPELADKLFDKVEAAMKEEPDVAV